MASIVGENYKNATSATTSGSLLVTDKIFGYLDKLGHIYTELRYPRAPLPGDPNYAAYLAQQRALEQGIFGLPRPFGFLLLAGGVGFIAFIVYKVATVPKAK